MAKKKYYDEDGNQVRSRPSKPFYKKWPVWMIVFLSIVFGAIGIYTIGGEEKEVDDPVAKKEIKKEIEMKNKDSEHTDLDEENLKKQTQTYTYEDFKGTYVTFKGEPYKSSIAGMSDIIVIGDDSYHSFNRWDLDMTSIVKNKTIVESTLTLDLDSDEDEMWGLHSESGSEQFELRQDGDKKILYSITNDESLYSMSKEDLQTHYTQSEIDYARIIMTLRGVPSQDFWGVFSSEHDGGKPVIGVTHNDKGDFIPYTDDEDDVGYPEDVTNLYLKNKTRQDEISYTYSSIKDGYIRVYPVPLNHAIRTGEEVINDAKEKYIKPFEPYEVADFIGNVEFDED